MGALTVDLTRRTWELFRERKGTKGCYKRCRANPPQPKPEDADERDSLLSSDGLSEIDYAHHK